MKVLERHVQKLERGKWEAYLEREQKFETVEQRLGGFPAKRHYRALSGEDVGTVVWEREWESPAAWEDGVERLLADSEARDASRMPSVVSERIEYYMVVD